MKTIKKAVKYFGSQAELARKIGIRHDQPYKWLNLINFPSTKHALAIEKETQGGVTAEEILVEKAKFQFKKRLKAARKIKKDKDQI